jgi:Site-specific recombinase XerD
MVFMQEIKTCVDKERTPTANEIKAAPQLERLATQLVNDGRDKLTVRNYRTYLSYLLINGADLFEPESTKAVLAAMPMKKNTKRLIVSLLVTWYEYNGIAWKKPTYDKESEIPYIPTREELNELIAGFGKVLATFCYILRDTGARSGEIARLQWSAINFKTNKVNIKAEKRSNGRELPLSDETMNMLCKLKRRPDGKIFSSISSLRSNFVITRNRLAERNPNYLKIHFHTFRHWKATTELHDTHDRERVQIILGHKNADSTETYVHIDKMLYLETKADQFITKRPITPEEEDALINVGFEFVRFDQKNDVPIYRKRK